MYAVELFFDAPFEAYVRSVWKTLSDRNISTEMQDICGVRPHLTMAVYDDIPRLDTFFERFSAWTESSPAIHLKFDVLAFFPASGTLFLGPTVTDSLIRWHRQYHAEFDELLPNPHSFYVPNQWVPHCTLAIRLTPDQAAEAMAFCYPDFRPLQTRVIEAGVVKLGYDSNHRCTSSSTIHFGRVGDECR
ncbi:2'-5' RNA ligase family protein [Paenibacillus humicola]|uniref:2'-5' RNA ligase family protein n=1 Tax=Paenibacillus humicola TaxID=3110540 RepID=UPI00237B30D2|nr:2'-5' RNA ligase family protein [Paenibacillus humicola]